jgi:glycosyltransferase involved in cell wall biosynthesis
MKFDNCNSYGGEAGLPVQMARAIAAEIAPPASVPPPPRKPRIAIVHDFLYCYAGAERVLEQMLKVYPDADLFTLFDFLPAKDRGFIGGRKVRPSFLQRMPLAKTHHRAYLPLMPLAIEQLDLSVYDIIVSSSYVAAKGVLTSCDQMHICYCHTPVRFAWDLHHQYLRESGLTRGFKSAFARLILHYIRAWDVQSARSVDTFLTNSNFVGRRINKAYRRAAKTIYPPVDTDFYTPGGDKGDFYVTVSRLVPYKRIDLIVEAFNKTPDRKLVVIGEGPEFEKINAMAKANVTLLGRQSDTVLRDHLRRARAFVFAAEEDFGIVIVEAQACGTPVIAFSRGGASETVVEGVTGEFFQDQSVDSLVDAVDRFETRTGWDADKINQNARRFGSGRFRDEFRDLVEERWQEFRLRRARDPRLDLQERAQQIREQGNLPMLVQVVEQAKARAEAEAAYAMELEECG